MKTENYCRCSKCIEQEEETAPAPTPWSAKSEAYWQEQYQLMREKYHKQLGERIQLREALECLVDWNPKCEYWERPETVVRFEADMEKARKILEETE